MIMTPEYVQSMSLNNTQAVKDAVKKPIAEISNGNGKKNTIKTVVLCGLGAAAAISVALLAIRKGKSVNLNKTPTRRQVLKFWEKQIDEKDYKVTREFFDKKHKETVDLQKRIHI